ncbi:MAG: hypothetical protein WCQ55_07210 [Paludibacteraceae bacterium]
MEKNIQIRVALRYHALYLDTERNVGSKPYQMSVSAMAFVSKLKENGYSVSEELLHALSKVDACKLADISDTLNNVMGLDLNWTPLVKGWGIPTGESIFDHLSTLAVNIFCKKSITKGTTLPCGHLIPDGTFNMERYNGCPFCGTPFATSNLVFRGQGSKLKELRLFTDTDLKNIRNTLLTSTTPLDATQKESLRQLLPLYGFPEETNVTMKETAMLVCHHLVETGKPELASHLLKTPTDILRYLWYEKTGQVQIVEPKTWIALSKKSHRQMWNDQENEKEIEIQEKKRLRLKYDRKSCLRVALWMNGLSMSAHQTAENMNSKRSMWVRIIRALRLSEYSHRKGFSQLEQTLDVFYKKEYTTWQGKVDNARERNEEKEMLHLLKQCPGRFARCLFATMLRFGPDKTLRAFDEVADSIPARLLLSLGNTAESYFDPDQIRLARPITGVVHKIEANKLLGLYSLQKRQSMTNQVMEIYKSSMARRFKRQKPGNTTIFVEPSLYHIPISVGDRSTTIQDRSCALMGTRFPIEGDAIRLFLQWGKGLPAQHLDMDLSARISLPLSNTDECAYYHLTCSGAKHSGDIRHIPDKVGTAEYIELSLPMLKSRGAKYVTFTCNAYSSGVLSPNLMVGWMDSAFPMKVSEENGVSYDPSCVQHMVRISENNLSKGLVFGVLDVDKSELIWLEMPFTAQTLRGADADATEILLHKLDRKLTIGQLLDIKARAQHLTIVSNPEDADESYTYEWALNPAEVSQMFNI